MCKDWPGPVSGENSLLGCKCLLFTVSTHGREKTSFLETSDKDTVLFGSDSTVRASFYLHCPPKSPESVETFSPQAFCSGNLNRTYVLPLVPQAECTQL